MSNLPDDVTDDTIDRAQPGYWDEPEPAEPPHLFSSISKTDRVLVTGGTGTLGQALLPALLARGARVRVLSRDECKQGELRRRYPEVEWVLGDVRYARDCQEAVHGVSFVIHAASLKYVDIGETQPSQYVETNVQGTVNMVEAVLWDGGVRACIGISTDKACNPINVYGLTKALLERLFVEAHARRRGEGCDTVFTVCRYGNVIGSRGSVVLKWQEAQAAGQKIKVTVPSMTRFFFTVADALRLIDIALQQEQGGRIIAARMPSTTIGELASLWGEYDVIGPRGGEKMHEDLISTRERERTWFDQDSLSFVYQPVGEYRFGVDRPYTSENAPRLTLDELAELTAEWRKV